ncbi:TetR/AcrR family transcriptional regulator [Paenibacillus chartarius]|uniref:TetR/AcrR family transcriptional regulator n=1 Tax=Paenibacillus chartarius TaxID=747481 RepID=A0ABV6DUT8_9BACL
MSPRTKEQNEKIREERMKQIRLATVQVYLQKGYQGAEIGDIAKQAGLARGLVYYYYKDKTELFQFVFTHYLEGAKQFVAATLLTEEPPLDRLKRYARFYLDNAVTRPNLVALYRNIPADIPHVFGERAKVVLDDFMANISMPLIRTMEEGARMGIIVPADTSLLAQMFWGCVAGAMAEFGTRALTPEEAEPHIRDVLDMLLRMITAAK